MQLEAIDKQMSIEHKGTVYQNNDGVIDVPDSVGEKFIKESQTGKREFVGRHTKSYSMGSGISQEKWDRIFGES